MAKLLLGILVLCGLGITHAVASDNGAYIYAGAGQAKLQPTGWPGGTAKDVETFQVLAGYQFDRNWSIEGKYVDLGNETYSANGTFGGVTGLVNLSAKGSATSLVAARIWDLQAGRNHAFSFLAKLGFAQVKTSNTVIVTTPPAVLATFKGEYSKRGVTFGLGAKFKFDENWALRLDADSFDTGHSNFGRVGNYSLGLGYEF